MTAPRQTEDIDPMLGQCWPTVYDAGPTLRSIGQMSRVCWDTLLQIFFADGVVRYTASPGFDYETIPSYKLTIEVTDGEETTTNILTVNIVNINESPYVTSTAHTVAVSESEVSSIVVADVDASDPDSDVLFYDITSITPAGAPFIIGSLLGITISL